MRITGNSALVCLRAGFATTGVVGAGGRVDIARNAVRGLGVGIAFAGDDTRVADNDVKLLTGAVSTRKEGSLVAMGTAMSRGSGLLSESLERVAAYLALFGGAGIVAVPGLRPRGIDRAQIRGNRVTGLIGDGIALRTRIVSAQINGNVVQQVGGDGITMSEKATAEELAIEDNQLFEIGRRRRGDATSAPSSARSCCATSSTPWCSATRSASSAKTRRRRSAGSGCSPAARSTCASARTRSST